MESRLPWRRREEGQSRIAQRSFWCLFQHHRSLQECREKKAEKELDRLRHELENLCYQPNWARTQLQQLKDSQLDAAEKPESRFKAQAFQVEIDLFRSENLPTPQPDPIMQCIYFPVQKSFKKRSYTIH